MSKCKKKPEPNQAHFWALVKQQNARLAEAEKEVEYQCRRRLAADKHGDLPLAVVPLHMFGR